VAEFDPSAAVGGGCERGCPTLRRVRVGRRLV